MFLSVWQKKVHSSLHDLRLNGDKEVKDAYSCCKLVTIEVSKIKVLITSRHFTGTWPVLEIKAILLSAWLSMKVGIGTFLKRTVILHIIREYQKMAVN